MLISTDIWVCERKREAIRPNDIIYVDVKLWINSKFHSNQRRYLGVWVHYNCLSSIFIKSWSHDDISACEHTVIVYN